MKINECAIDISYKILLKRIEKFISKTRSRIDWGEYPRKSQDIILQFGKWNSCIEDFIMTFQENFTKKQTDKMLYYLEHLNIIERWNKDSKEKIIPLGCFISEVDNIILERYTDIDIETKEEDTLMHELLHMASTKNTNIRKLTGFEIPTVIGKNLNEGYTEYLTQKYFSKVKTPPDENPERMILAKGIENIIGPQRMQMLYFNADLSSLINDLSFYVGREETIKIIYSMDYLDHTRFSREKIFKTLVDKIARINHMKLKRELMNNQITQEEYEEQYARVVLEFKKNCIWSEKAKIVGDDSSFMIHERGYSSGVYARKINKREHKKYQKNMRKNSQNHHIIIK